MRHLIVLALLGICAGAAAAAAPIAAERKLASSTPHTIYKCDVDGRILYTDKPCIGARRLVPVALHGIDPASDPTSAASGEALAWSEEHGSDAAESFASTPYASPARAMRFVTRVDPECPHLAQRMALVEAEERRASSETRAAIQERLSIQRQRYLELGC